MKTTRQFLLEALTTGILTYWEGTLPMPPQLILNVQSIERESGGGKTFNVYYLKPNPGSSRPQANLFVTLID